MVTVSGLGLMDRDTYASVDPISITDAQSVGALSQGVDETLAHVYKTTRIASRYHGVGRNETPRAWGNQAVRGERRIQWLPPFWGVCVKLTSK